MNRQVGKVVGMVVFLYAAGFTLSVCEGCGPKSVSATAAESAYTADLLRCVDESSTLAESRACREKVDAKWGITETVTRGAR